MKPDDPRRRANRNRFKISIGNQRPIAYYWNAGCSRGSAKDTYDFNLNFDFNPRKRLRPSFFPTLISITAAIYPTWSTQGFRGPIYATPGYPGIWPDIMLKDSGHIHEYDVKYVNKKRAKKGLPAVEPLYTMADAARTTPLFNEVGYEKEFQPVPCVTARFLDAGHILGSASVLLDLEEGGRKTRLWFSGDIGRPDKPFAP